jgi:dynein heavy chain
MIKLWAHEASRVFHDRLISSEDKRWFTEHTIGLTKNILRMEWTHADLFESKPLIFGDFMKFDESVEDRKYDEVKDTLSMSSIIVTYLEEYNKPPQNNRLDLVLFPECLEHISRVCRILRQPRGNALLVGVGGSGKQTLTRLSAFIAGTKFDTLEIKKNFTQNDFRENLKKAMLPCGIKNERTTFLINDNQITNESFLEDINNLLNSGEIPNLWAPEDKELINNEMRKAAAEKGVFENIYGFYLSRMRDMFHIVLCLSPVGESFRLRVRMFPSLVNCCAINWVMTWPEEALLSVSSRFI